MRQSTSPFKKSPFSNSPQRLRPFLVFGGLSFAAASFWGCQLLWDAAPTPSSPEARRVYTSSVKVILKDKDNHEVYVGDFDRGSCTNGFPLIWSFSFKSLLGIHAFDIDYTADSQESTQTQSEVSVKTQQQAYTLKLGPLPTQLMARNICEESKIDNRIVFTEKQPDTEELFQTFRAVAPDCDFGLSEGKDPKDPGLVCKLTHAKAPELLTQLDSLKKNMTTKWNHQPYLLIRRLTLATQLLEALRAGESSPELKKTCRVIQYSLPDELPLSFRSKGWQEKVCLAKSADPDVTLLGLEQAVKEIQTLSSRIEDASLIGLFTLAVPRDQSTAKEYWISLQPIDRPLVMSEVPPQTTSCVWHPVYGEQPEYQLIATDLGQIQHSDKSFCSPSPTLARAKRDADAYVRSSIASEMEFQIANGQSKKLRLPTGDYRYSISTFSGPFPEEMTTAQEITPLSTGHVSWKTARPHLIIKTW